jgi:soluble lytic murein transglycosylase-like protein
MREKLPPVARVARPGRATHYNHMLLRLSSIYIFILLALWTPDIVPGLFRVPVISHVRPEPLPKEQIALVSYLAAKYHQSVDATVTIVKSAYAEGLRRGVPPLLVLAIIEKESSLKPAAKSNYGALGLMQVVPRFHGDKLQEESHPEGLYDPDTNIRVGTKILAEYLDKKRGNVENALKQYSGNASDYTKKVSALRTSLEAVKQKSQVEPPLADSPRSL